MKTCKLTSHLLLAILWFSCAVLAADTPSLTFKFKTYSVPGALQTWLTGINNSGVIVGWYVDQQGNCHGFSLTNGKFKQIDDPDGDQTQIFGINSKGEIVGSYHDPCVEELCYEGFLRQGKNFTNIGPPWFRTPPEDDAPQSVAYGINDGGVIVGQAGDGFGGEVGFLLKNHKYKALKVPHVNGDLAVGINKAGLVTINWVTDTSSGASIYDGKTFEDISVPGGGDSFAGGINNLGDVVLAFGSIPGSHINGALFHSHKYYKFVYPKAKDDTFPLGINDKRTIVGAWAAGGTHDIHVHGFVATY
jgi:uncharacterized membrane protein